MKTIYTCLPIYDKLSKQCYERATHAKNSGIDKPVPTITSRHRLPSFQWLDDGDGAASVSAIELIDIDGETYNAPIRFSSWVNLAFDTFVTSGLNVTSAIAHANNAAAYITPKRWIAKTGETIRVKGTLTYISTGTAAECQITIYNGGLESHTENILEGDFEVTFTFTADGGVGDEVGVSLYSGWGPKNFTISNFEVTIDRINQWMPTMPALYTDGTSTWFTYEGDTLNYLLPEGLYYLKITMDNGYVYYSEWFLVDCVYENLITAWANSTYETFTSSGAIITSAIETGADGVATSNAVFSVRKGEVIKIIFYRTKNSGSPPKLYFRDLVTATDLSTETACADATGLEEMDITITANSDNASLIIYNDSAANWFTSEILANRSYSEEYLTINFTHSCNLGDIYYEGGLIQTLFLESETMEPVFPYTEKGAENGFGQFVPTWQRQEKNQLIRTNLIPQHIVEVLHRLKLHDTITLIDLVGDGFTVEEIETEHDWQFDDKYYAMAKITVDLGETIVITGCCTAVNVC